MFQNLFGRTFEKALAGFVIVTLASCATFFSPLAFQSTFWVLLAIVAILGAWKLQYAVYVFLAEIFFGSQGRLFSVTIHGFSLSLRMGIFIILLVLWLLQRKKNALGRIFSTPVGWWLFLLSVLVALGVLIGFLYGSSARFLYFDANAFLFVLSALWIFATVRTREHLSDIFQILAASVVFLSLFTLALFFLFSHGYSVVPEVYRWVRDTRMFEITAMGNNFFRVFSQAQFYSLVAFFLLLPFAVLSPGTFKQKRGVLLLLFLTSCTLFVSMSRSFWVAAVLIGGAVVLPLFFKLGGTIKKGAGYVGIFLGAMLFEALLLSFLANFPAISGRPGSPTTLQVLSERSTDTTEVAATSRYALFSPLLRASLRHPFLGSGFGTTVTYSTRDPRIVTQTGGTYTTYAFEWGYLDIFLKLGVVGLFVFVGLFVALMRELWSIFLAAKDPLVRFCALGLFVAIIVLYATHALSPYLNHPLGIGLLILVAALLGVLRSDVSEKTFAP
ncbi:MAG: O-antigen ligase family protein [bacterium]